jgi:tRNA modification GTPase
VAAAAQGDAGPRTGGLSEGTIVAPASAPGPAPRCVVRVSGPAAFAIAGRVFLHDAPGPLGAGFRTGLLVLDALGTACPAHAWGFAAPASCTGEDVVELHVFGAPALVDAVLRGLIARGARLAFPGEFTRRALENGKLDLTRAEAVLALVRARDEDEHRKARALLEGGLARAVAGFMDRVIALLVPIEASLDFSDQEIPLFGTEGLAPAARALAKDLSDFQVSRDAAARRLLPRVVLRGPANAGKSTLFNALLGSDVALATPVRGTTRDTLAAEWRHAGVRAVLVDTAGDDVLDAPVDRLARDVRERALLEADLVLEVRDLRRGGWPRPAPGALRVGTMLDLAALEERAVGDDVVAVSARTGTRLDALRDRIAAALREGAGRHAAPFLVTARQKGHLERARIAVERGAGALVDAPAELAASDLRDALGELRAVVGAEGGDPVLDRIFREFCIGK